MKSIHECMSNYDTIGACDSRSSTVVALRRLCWCNGESRKGRSTRLGSNCRQQTKPQPFISARLDLEPLTSRIQTPAATIGTSRIFSKGRSRLGMQTRSHYLWNLVAVTPGVKPYNTHPLPRRCQHSHASCQGVVRNKTRLAIAAQ